MNRFWILLWCLCIPAWGLEVTKIDADRIQGGTAELNKAAVAAINQYRAQLKELGINISQNRQAEEEKAILVRLMRSKGYYQGETSRQGLEPLTYRVTSGPLYRLAHINLINPSQLELPDPLILPIKEGDPFDADQILAAVKTLQQLSEQESCRLEVKVSYKASLDNAKRLGYLDLEMIAGRLASIGSIAVEGLDTVDELWLKKQIPLRVGRCATREAVNRSVLALYQTNLLASVNADIQPINDRQVALTFKVKERSHRTIKLGGGASTDLGLNVSGGWQHRNVFGQGEVLDVDTSLAFREQRVSSYLNLPKQPLLDATISLTGEIEQQRINKDLQDQSGERDVKVSYSDWSGTVGLKLERPLLNRRSAATSALLSLNYANVVEMVSGDGNGISLENLNEDDQGGISLSLSFPSYMTYDRRDDSFNPTTGLWAKVGVTPVFYLLDDYDRFMEVELAGRSYVSFWSTTFAASLQGKQLINLKGDSDIQTQDTLFVGGGGSVRGADYRALDQGLTTLVLNLEWRQRLGDWGWAVFTDVGLLSREPLEYWFGQFADRSNDYPISGDDADIYPGRGIVGAGVGVRYFTSFAPIRFDVAVPLYQQERSAQGFEQSFRPTLDGFLPFAFYFSIGQAF